jgi:hypothetical protein
MQAMLKLHKLDITALKQAYIGKSGSVTKPKSKQAKS